MFVYQIGSSVNAVMEGGMPAPIGKEADMVTGLDNFIYPGENDSFNPFADPKSIVKRIEETTESETNLITYTITFNANGGSGDMEAIEVIRFRQVVVPACAFTAPANKEFANYNTAADGSGNIVMPNTAIIPEADITLYAIYKDVV